MDRRFMSVFADLVKVIVESEADIERGDDKCFHSTVATIPDTSCSITWCFRMHATVCSA